MSTKLNKLIKEELNVLSEKKRKILHDKLKEKKNKQNEALKSIIEEEYDKLYEANVDKVKNQLVKVIDNLKKNFVLYKKAKNSDNEKDAEKYKKIALSLTKAKKQLESELENAIAGLFKDAELQMEGRGKKVTKYMWKKMDDDARENALLTVIKDPDDRRFDDFLHSDWKDLPGWMQRDMLTEGELNEVTAKATWENAVNALTKTIGGRKFDKGYVKDYLKQIEKMARKNPGQFVKDYGDFKVGDWIEDVRYNMANESVSENKLNEITLKGKDADTWIKNWGAGGRLNIDNMIYKSLGKGKWKGPTGKTMSWKEVAALAVEEGDNRVYLEGKINEISAGAGMKDILKGKTTSIEGIKMSKELIHGITSWIAQSPYGRKYGKHILKGRIHSMIGPANAMGIERYLKKPGTKKEWQAIYKKFGPKREAVIEQLKKLKEGVSNYIHIEKTFTLKDMKGKTVTLRRGDVGKHERFGWDEDVMTFGNHKFDASPGSEWDKKVKRDMISVS